MVCSTALASEGSYRLFRASCSMALQRRPLRALRLRRLQGPALGTAACLETAYSVPLVYAGFSHWQVSRVHIIFNGPASSTLSSVPAASSASCSGLESGCVPGNGILSAVGAGGVLSVVSSIIFNNPAASSASLGDPGGFINNATSFLDSVASLVPSVVTSALGNIESIGAGVLARSPVNWVRLRRSPSLFYLPLLEIWSLSAREVRFNATIRLILLLHSNPATFSRSPFCVEWRWNRNGFD
ncbi:hypothetical protein C8F01DRAFT_613700 [Mycena amicta]|nr:hypothetical protein C8F01DRAFT_613700 [Mycena amicta]